MFRRPEPPLYVEKPARVSSTCLVSVARNRYSVPCELAGQIDPSLRDSGIAVGVGEAGPRQRDAPLAAPTRQLGEADLWRAL